MPFARHQLNVPLETVLESAHEAFIAIDEHGRIVAWNREAERTFGWERDAVIGRLLRDTIIPHRYRPRHDAGLRRFVETGEGPLVNRRVEISALHSSGHEFPVELTISPLHEGGRWSFHAFLHDISDRYRANELQSRLATLVEHSADAIITRTSEGVITSWNPGAERLYGYSAQEMLGATVDGLVPGDREGEAAELIARALRGEAIEGFETQGVCKDGRVIDVSITISPIRDDAGRVSELSMIARDITMRKASERALAHAYEELKRTNELKSQFVAIASHELRTPLTSIMGFATTVLEGWERLPDDDKRRFLEIIEAQGKRLARLVEQLLLFSTVEAGKVATLRRPVDVAAAARDVIVELRLESEVELSGDHDATVDADPDHLHQILVNYLTNARRYGAPPFGLSVERDGDGVVVCVSDCGEGVSDEFAPHLFSSFTRGEVTDRSAEGSGLGLAIVKGLADASGGDVWFEPNAPRGARFFVRLPTASGRT